MKVLESTVLIDCFAWDVTDAGVPTTLPVPK